MSFGVYLGFLLGVNLTDVVHLPGDGGLAIDFFATIILTSSRSYDFFFRFFNELVLFSNAFLAGQDIGVLCESDLFLRNLDHTARRLLVDLSWWLHVLVDKS